MCLVSIYEKFPKGRSGEGYKTFRVDSSGNLYGFFVYSWSAGCMLVSSNPFISHEKRPKGVWLLANTDFKIKCRGSSDFYFSGWHIYKRKKDAEVADFVELSRGDVKCVKVKYRKARVVGGNYCDAEVIVADEIFIPKEVEEAGK